jgi:hypothetical protein
MSIEIMISLVVMVALIMTADAQEGSTLTSYVFWRVKYLFRKIRQTGLLIRRRVFMVK